MRNRNRGVSLLEITIVSAILVLVILMVYALLHSTSETYEAQSANLALDARARETLEEIARDLRMSDGNALWTGAPAKKVAPQETVSDLLFYFPGAFDMKGYAQNGNKLVLDQSIRYRWVCDESAVDGQDNDNDGLVDEGYVEKTPPAGSAVRICNDVPAEVLDWNEKTKKQQKGPGFRFDRDQDVVTVTLFVERLDPKHARVPVDPSNPTGPTKPRTIVRRAQTAVELRN